MISKIHFTQNPQNSENTQSFANKSNSKKKEKEYKDPLTSKWLTTVLYSTEFAALIHEIAPKTAQALWIPTFMYLGADIYDKYKNDKNHYAPSKKRGFDQILLQGLGGFLIPTATIFIGQKLTSPIGKFFNKGLSVNTKEATLNHIKSSLDQCVGDRFSTFENFETFVLQSLKNRIQACQNEKKSDGFLKRIFKFNHQKYALADKNTEKTLKFAKENIRTLYDIKELLKQKKKPKNLTKITFNKYITMSSNLKQTFGKDYANDALRYALKAYQNKLLMKNKIIKTIGGIIALVLTQKHIFNYFKKTFIPKYIDPRIDRFNRALLDSSKLKQHIKNTTNEAGTKN